MSGNIDWSLCIICQEKTSEELRCPVHNPLDVYSAFAKNVAEFKKINSLPVNIDLEMEGSHLLQKQAKWHKSCHQKFNNNKLERARLKRQRAENVDEDNCPSKRRSTERVKLEKGKELCVFCMSVRSEAVHEFTTFNANQSVTQMATDLGDRDLLAKLSGGDLVAIEAKYHFNCLSDYRNRYRAHLRSIASSTKGLADEEAKDQAFSELTTYIARSVEEGTQMFRLPALHTMYEDCLHKFGFVGSIHKTRLKKDVVDHFLTYGIQEQFDGISTIFVFPKGMKKMLQGAESRRSESSQFADIAESVRKEIFEHEKFKFSGHFPPNCQSDCVPYNLKLLISMILYGSPQKSEENINSQACLTIAQLILFNAKKKTTSDTKNRSRHSLDREPPLPVYLSLNVHSCTRNKKLIETLNELCISISYDRVIQLENMMAHSMCHQFQADNVVCPSHLRRGLFVVGALDNIDHTPSATTAQSSFNGTGLSIIQFPTKENLGVCRDPVTLEKVTTSKEPLLPPSYAIVPAVALNPNTTSVPMRKSQNHDGGLCRAKIREDSWLKKVSELLEADLTKNDPISWAAYHANLQPALSEPPAITAMLPLFYEHADTPAMIKHGMGIIRQVTEFLNPGQVPVMACDCPIFAKAKYIQWTWPALYAEDKFVVMFGGLHIEMALWNMLGDLLADSGWTISLIEAGVATSGTADSFLKAAHLTRTRHAHQVTIAALSKLQCQAFSLTNSEVCFEIWKASMIQLSPTFQFWNIVLELEKLVLVFIRAHREKNFELYIETLEALVGFFFALDHYNYARWIPIHLQDMKSLSTAFLAKFKQHWVVSKTSNRFSSMPLDQAHEQENAKVKGKGGMIGLTESQTALERWMICGPELANCLSEFEHKDGTGETTALHLHHEEGFAAQTKMHQQVKHLVDAITSFGNPFEDDCPELLVLNSRECADESVIDTVRTIETVGKTQYQKYLAEVIINGTGSIHDAIKKNSLPLFKSPRRKIKSKSAQQVRAQRHNASLFGRLYIANQQRDGDLSKFFSHENQSTPPSLSDFGSLRLGQKSALLTCFDFSNQPTHPEQFDGKVFDGSAVVHFLPTAPAKTFAEYADTVFTQFLLRQLQSTSRVDCVWDRYLASSLKELTRIHRGSGSRTKVSGQTILPRKWSDFLKVAANKTELYNFLTSRVDEMQIPDNKTMFITQDSAVVCKGTEQPMQDCNHEEADSRIVVHVRDSLERGCSRIMVRTVDTDVVVVLIGQFYQFLEQHPSADIWVAFGTSKQFQFFHINTVCEDLGKDKCMALPAFHAFTGCDTTSSFFGKSKKSAWATWNSFPEATEAFLYIAKHPFTPVDLESPHFLVLERFTVLLYHRVSTLLSVNEARRELFCKKNKTLENIPPTQDALLQHVRRAVFQSNIWTTSHCIIQNIPMPEGWGWSKCDNAWRPVWMTIPDAARACSELIKCGCKSKKGCSSRCTCCKAGLPCTDLCNCTCEI